MGILSRHAAFRPWDAVAHVEIRRSVPRMNKPSAHATPARVDRLVLDVVALHELRRTHQIESDAELARMIGVDRTTLARVAAGGPPSNGFMARTKLLFPSAPLDRLFVVERLLATRHQVGSAPLGLRHR